jgi:GT2 family glycosyltransferase
MYVGHLFVIRRHLFEQLGGLRTECDGSQDYDLALRATERGRSVVHVPIIGYHWRRAPGSTAVDYGAKPFAHTSAHRALNDAMERRGEQATVDDGLLQSTFRVKRSIQGAPRVSVVVPVVDESHHLQQCLDAIGALAGYDNREVVLVDGGSWKPETKAVLAHASHDAAVKVVSASAEEGRFALHNAGAAHTSGELILFLDPRTTARSAGWLEALVEHAQRPDVGATGARIVFPDGHLAHAGLALGLGDQPAGRAFWGCPPDNSGYWGHGRMVRNWSAVSVDCLMTPRRLFEECGGFDGALAPAFADVDYCLRLRQRGLLVVYTPYAELVLNRPPSWASDRRDGDAARVMRDRWGALLDDDPYFNRNLDRLRPEFALPR